MLYTDNKIYSIDNNKNINIDNTIIFLHYFTIFCENNFFLPSDLYSTVLPMPFIVFLLSTMAVMSDWLGGWLALLAVRFLAYNVLGDNSGRGSWKRS